MFDKLVYIDRRDALKAALSSERGILLFIGNADAPAQYHDNAYKWRQDSNWLYFWGIDEPLYAATIDLDSGEETIYADDFSIDDIVWTGPVPSVREQAESTGVTRTAPYGALDTFIASARAAGRKIHFLPASRYFNAIRIAGLTGLKPLDVFSPSKAGCPFASEAFVRAVIGMRLVKDELEIAEIDKACDLGYEMHTVARRGIRCGRVEQEIVAAMEGHTLSKGWGTSFPTILTQHGEVFHCHSHAMPVEPGKLMVIDAGAELDSHYVSDFTRTYPTGGRFTSKQRDIYQTVFECNELAFSMVRPGVRYVDCHLAVARHLLENLRDLDLVRGSVDDMMDAGIAGLFLPHGLGHNMGLDAHDMEDLGENLVGYDDDQSRSSLLGLGSLRMARSLKPGNVITDEPGIYFIPALIESWKADGTGGDFVNYDKLSGYYDFGGIRLEDDVLVTEGGARRLGSRRLPISPDEVESAMEND